MKGQLMPKVTVWLAAMAALLLPQGLAAQPAAAPDRALAVGTVISSGAATIGGWRRVYGSTYAKRVQTGADVAETQECCFAVYQRGNALLVLRTEPVSRDKDGAALSERVVASKWLTRKPSETVTHCDILWITPQISLYDNKTDAIRSVVIVDSEFELISWRDPGAYCAHGD